MWNLSCKWVLYIDLISFPAGTNTINLINTRVDVIVLPQDDRRTSVPSFIRVILYKNKTVGSVQHICQLNNTPCPQIYIKISYVLIIHITPSHKDLSHNSTFSDQWSVKCSSYVDLFHRESKWTAKVRMFFTSIVNMQTHKQNFLSWLLSLSFSTVTSLSRFKSELTFPKQYTILIC